MAHAHDLLHCMHSSFILKSVRLGGVSFFFTSQCVCVCVRAIKFDTSIEWRF